MPGIHNSINFNDVKEDIENMSEIAQDYHVLAYLRALRNLNQEIFFQWAHLVGMVLIDVQHAEECLEQGDLPGANQWLNEADEHYAAAWKLMHQNVPMPG